MGLGAGTSGRWEWSGNPMRALLGSDPPEEPSVSTGLVASQTLSITRSWWEVCCLWLSMSIWQEGFCCCLLVLRGNESHWSFPGLNHRFSWMQV